MSLLVRKIARGKWPDECICPLEQLRADAISDLRTSGDTLSVWKIDNINDMDTAVLALSASSKTEKIENISVVWMDEEDLKNKKINLDCSQKGDTVVIDLQDKHVNLVRLNYSFLGIVASLIMQKLKQDNFRRFTKSQVEKLLVQAYKANRIPQEACSEKLFQTLQELSKNK
ncbi:MAG: hypothetical protein IJS99_03955 [Synergistaceae bacterium]|nr:hypothetical protein [Synergistaceae bacterium]